MPADRVLTEASLRADRGFTEDIAKIQKARPDWDTLKKDFGSSLAITDTPDGKRDGRLDLTDPAKKKRFLEMTRASKRLESDLGQSMRGGLQTVAFRTPQGQEERVPEHMADHVARKRGLRPLRRIGRPTHRTVVSASGVHFVYAAPSPGADLEFVRAYRMVGCNEVEVQVG